MPPLEDMAVICRRLLDEMSTPLDHYRLREIETVLRLLVPPLTRALLRAIRERGEIPSLREAGSALIHARNDLEWVDENRAMAAPSIVQEHLSEAAGEALRGLAALG